MSRIGISAEYRQSGSNQCQLLLSGHLTCNGVVTVLRETVLVDSGNNDPPGDWIAPSGGNRSGGGGNKTAGASGEEGGIGDSASRKAVTRVRTSPLPHMARACTRELPVDPYYDHRWDLSCCT